MCEELVMALIACDEGVYAHMLRSMDEAGLPGYTVTQNATGFSENGRRDNSPVWPGINTMIYCACTKEQYERLKQCVTDLRESRVPRHVPLRLFCWNVSEIF